MKVEFIIWAISVKIPRDLLQEGTLQSVAYSRYSGTLLLMVAPCHSRRILTE